MYHYSKKGPSHPTRVILGLIYMARDERDKTFRDQAKLSRRSSPCNLPRPVTCKIVDTCLFPTLQEEVRAKTGCNVNCPTIQNRNWAMTLKCKSWRDLIGIFNGLMNTSILAALVRMPAGRLDGILIREHS